MNNMTKVLWKRIRMMKSEIRILRAEVARLERVQETLARVLDDYAEADHGGGQ